jgi:hypothetical protein
MVYGDSLVVISQVNKDWECSTEVMTKYCVVVRQIEDMFEGPEFHHMERDHNVAADTLSKLGSIRAPTPPNVFVQEIHHPNIPQDSGEECKATKDNIKLIDKTRLTRGYPSSSISKMKKNRMTKQLSSATPGSLPTTHLLAMSCTDVEPHVFLRDASTRLWVNTCWKR